MHAPTLLKLDAIIKFGISILYTYNDYKLGTRQYGKINVLIAAA